MVLLCSTINFIYYFNLIYYFIQLYVKKTPRNKWWFVRPKIKSERLIWNKSSCTSCIHFMPPGIFSQRRPYMGGTVYWENWILSKGNEPFYWIIETADGVYSEATRPTKHNRKKNPGMITPLSLSLIFYISRAIHQGQNQQSMWVIRGYVTAYHTLYERP